ncbi:thrAB operon attenuation leader peptide ThrL [Shewanella marisflavi]|uniref:ThrAB operon attenuation leader peptide ThrL n=1 Tax=Shewanella marisflavi TaxID=260364 RepID=A0ABX5WRR1_9GAMM|nr:thrAB operon attenuation leader peptide ThrL [Shewanella marisflavi]
MFSLNRVVTTIITTTTITSVGAG